LLLLGSLMLASCTGLGLSPEDKSRVVEAALAPAKDSRCIEFLGFKFCYTRERIEPT
jgi:hypothetical protein